MSVDFALSLDRLCDDSSLCDDFRRSLTIFDDLLSRSQCSATDFSRTRSLQISTHQFSLAHLLTRASDFAL